MAAWNQKPMMSIIEIINRRIEIQMSLLPQAARANACLSVSRSRWDI